MVPPLTAPCWRDLLSGRNPYPFKLASAAMCVARNQRLVRQDSSPQVMEKCVEEVHQFFTKYERLVADDLQNAFN